jgi:hypothetical protein
LVADSEDVDHHSGLAVEGGLLMVLAKPVFDAANIPDPYL